MPFVIAGCEKHSRDQDQRGATGALLGAIRGCWRVSMGFSTLLLAHRCGRRVSRVTSAESLPKCGSS